MEETVERNRRIKPSTREELEGLNKSNLIEHILRLEAHNFQLKNLLQKKLNESTHKTTREQSQKKTSKRSFDFSKAHRRHVLLKILYFGWDYHGFAAQEDSHNTIEHHLFEALSRTCLIESRSTSNYHRCGRTDKSVSAFCQVISIDLRSKFSPEEQHSEEALKDEINYCSILNKVLPANIQCIAWKPLKLLTYSARFNCTSRTYRYYFPRGSLNIEAMRNACKLLERHADFRNFCKMDVANGVTCFMRNVQSANINVCNNNNESNEITDYTMFYLEITANAFLFHQIRCIMTVLFLIGNEKEEPSIVSELLDVEKNPCKPQYNPASGVPLNLYRCEFSNLEDSDKDLKSEWLHDSEALVKLIEDLQSQWTIACVKTTMIRDEIDELIKSAKKLNVKSPEAQTLVLQELNPTRQYQKLLNRKRCESLENRIDHFVKKQRLVTKTNDNKK